SVFLTLMIALSSCAQDLRGRHIFPVHSALATPISVSVGRPDHSSVRFGTILSMQGLSSAPGPNSFSAGGGIASNSDPNQFRDTPPVNTVAYVGGGISTKDIGTQINDAYNSLPEGGGDIYLLPKQGGGCYQFSTPIVMMTSGKYARLHTVGPGAAINN